MSDLFLIYIPVYFFAIAMVIYIKKEFWDARRN